MIGIFIVEQSEFVVFHVNLPHKRKQKKIMHRVVIVIFSKLYIFLSESVFIVASLKKLKVKINYFLNNDVNLKKQQDLMLLLLLQFSIIILL